MNTQPFVHLHSCHAGCSGIYTGASRISAPRCASICQLVGRAPTPSRSSPNPLFGCCFLCLRTLPERDSLSLDHLGPSAGPAASWVCSLQLCVCSVFPLGRWCGLVRLPAAVPATFSGLPLVLQLRNILEPLLFAAANMEYALGFSVWLGSRVTLSVKIPGCRLNPPLYLLLPPRAKALGSAPWTTFA